MNAAPIGEIIFVHPFAEEEIWISNSEGTTARKLFRQTFYEIKSIELQRDGEYVVVTAYDNIKREQIADNVQRITGNDDVYILDRRHPERSAINITQGEYDSIFYADISEKGDVIFLTRNGFQLVKNEEVTKRKPKVELILDIAVWSVEYIQWAPDGKHIAYISNRGLFILNVKSKKVFRITHKARYNIAAFSPDSQHIAFSTDVHKEGERWGIGIAIAPVQPEPEIEIFHVKENYSYYVQSWSPDGQYIAYKSYLDPDLIKNLELFRSIGNFVIPASGGEPEPILITMKRTVEFLGWVGQTYPVEPADSLVTTWGGIKAQKTD